MYKFNDIKPRTTFQNNSTFRFSSFAYDLYSLLYLSDTKVDLPTKIYFLLAVFAFPCVYSYACAVENPKISGFCVSKIRAVPTDNERVRQTQISRINEWMIEWVEWMSKREIEWMKEWMTSNIPHLLSH